MPIEIQPIDKGSLDSCPTIMGEKLKELIPLIEKALEEADGANPYAVYSIEDIKKALGSGVKSSYSFAACINRLIEDNYRDKTKVVAHSQRGNIRFDRMAGNQTKIVVV